MAAKKIRSSVLLDFWFVVVLFLSFSLLLKQVILRKKAVGESFPPQQVKISNVTDQSFTVSWFTEEKTSGVIIFSDLRETVEKQTGNLQTAYDIRGPATWSKIHYVTLENLRPNQSYYFAIKSGVEFYYEKLEGSWNKDGVAVEQKTAPKISFDTQKKISSTNTEGAFSLEAGAWNSCSDGSKNGTVSPCFRPNLVWGKVKDENGGKVQEAIVFGEIPGKSSILSSLSDKESSWAINLANLYNQNLAEFLTYDPDVDLIRLTAQDGEKRTASLYQLIPYVFARNCLNLPPQKCLQTPSDETNPIALELVLASPTPSPTTTLPPSSIPTIHPSPTPFSSLGMKIKFQGVDRQGPSKKIKVFLKKPGEEAAFLSSQITIESDNSGSYYGEMINSPTGTFNLFIKEPTHLGKQFPSFKINLGQNLLDASGSPFLAGDLNNDNKIDIQDLGILLGEFRSDNPSASVADLNLDGQVNTEDLGILISNYRQVGE